MSVAVIVSGSFPDESTVRNAVEEHYKGTELRWLDLDVPASNSKHWDHVLSDILEAEHVITI